MSYDLENSRSRTELKQPHTHTHTEYGYVSNVGFCGALNSNELMCGMCMCVCAAWLQLLFILERLTTSTNATARNHTHAMMLSADDGKRTTIIKHNGVGL